MSDTLLNAALALASGETLGRACPVFPLAPGTKMPHKGSRGVLEATADMDAIREWWTEHPEDNIGLSLGKARLIVLDVEGESHGYDAAEVVAGLYRTFGPLPDTRIAKTAGGGVHYLYGLPPGAHDRPPTAILGPDGAPIAGCERRRAGHYIVAPPSVRDGGGAWRWLNTARIAPAPEWLVPPAPPEREVGPPQEAQFEAGAYGTPYGLSGLEANLALIRDASDGQRHSAIYYAAVRCGELVAGGQLDEGHARHMLVKAAVDALGDEWPARGADETRAIDEGLAEGAKSPRKVTTEKDVNEWLERVGIKPAVEAPATETDPQVEPEPDEDRGSDALFIDWREFWTKDDEGPDWLIDGFIARGRAHSIYAKGGEGKSYVMLWGAAKLAADGVLVVYLDYEMTGADLRDRLLDMGYDEDADLSLFRYWLLPDIEALNTPAGAAKLIAVVDDQRQRHPAKDCAVIIDTFSRAVEGEENSNDTALAFYRWCGLPLKNRGVTVARLDHAGKDDEKGQRGGSAKRDDVDVVWKLSRTDDGVKLARDKGRMMWVPERTILRRVEDPHVGFEVAGAGGTSYPAGTQEMAHRLDALGVARDATNRAARAALKAAGEKVASAVLSAALRWRREHWYERTERGSVECAREGCEERFIPARADQRFCSSGCRLKAHRMAEAA